MRHYNNRDAARHVATNAGEPARDTRGIRLGGGTRRMVRAGTRCARRRPYQERNSKSCQLIERDSLLQTCVNDAARCVATVFEKWNCLIKVALHARRLPYERLTHTGLL